MRNTGPDQKTKDRLWARAGGTEDTPASCEGCGRLLTGQFSRQHRLARRAGGTRDPVINALSNLLLLCGSATSPGGCHLLCERRAPMAEDAGWFLRSRQDPHEVPVRLFGGRWVYLTDDGLYQDT